VFCEHKSFLRNHSPRATPPAASEKNPTAAPCSGILQWHQHANSKALTPLQLQHLEAAPCSGTSRPVPEQTRHSNSCTLQQQRAAAPSLAPLQHEPGTSRTLLAAPSSITLAAAPAGQLDSTTKQHLPPASAHQHARSKAWFKKHTPL